MSDPSEKLPPLSVEVKSSWHGFLDVFEPLRPALYRYCRHLTRTPWEAEDLVQEALMRAFVALGTLFHEVPNPRAWLFRVASNLWIDRVRRARFEGLLEHSDASALASKILDSSGTGDAPVEDQKRSAREAAGTLLGRLSPQERAAVVLKDVFEFSLDDTAHILTTTPGAVKAALHRGRGKLQTSDESEASRAPAPGVLDAFCAAFNARDIEGLANLLLESATVEIVGVVTEYGREPPKDPYTGSFAGTLSPITYDERGGVPPELLEGYLAVPPRAEVRAYRGEWILLFWYEHVGGPVVRTVMRIFAGGESMQSVARVSNYFFTPDVIAEVCTELGVPFRVNGYRYWRDRT